MGNFLVLGWGVLGAGFLVLRYLDVELRMQNEGFRMQNEKIRTTDVGLLRLRS